MTKYGDLETENPELAREWHPTKNNGLSPSDVTVKSGKSVWWLGQCGHEWQAKVSHRTDGQNCPICSSHILLAGFNDLEKKYPHIADEWHPNKNGELSPSEVFPASNKKVWWLGKCGHEWQGTISGRTKNNYGCPICSGKLIVPGINDLSTINPTLAKEWDYDKNKNFLPSTISPYSHKKVWWKCSKCGHRWMATIKHRTYGVGCPQCGRKQSTISKHKTDIETKGSVATNNPDLALEWHPYRNGDLLPTEVLSNSNKKVWWRCRKGHEWQAVVSSRNMGAGCPICDLENHTSFPEQAINYYLSHYFKTLNRYREYGKEIDIYIPERKIGIEYNGLFFHNSKESKERDANKVRFFRSHDIRIIQVVEGYTNTVDIDVITYRHDSTYSELKWVIEILGKIMGIEKHIEVDLDNDRAEIYAQYIHLEKENSLLSKKPLIAEEWHPTKNRSLTPDNVSFGSQKKVWWLGKCGHEWPAIISSRVAGHGCPYCNGYAVKEGFNDLSTKCPQLVDEWDYDKNVELLPSQVTPGSHRKVWWICSNCGHSWEATIKNRVNGTGCPNCHFKY